LAATGQGLATGERLIAMRHRSTNAACLAAIIPAAVHFSYASSFFMHHGRRWGLAPQEPIVGTVAVQKLGRFAPFQKRPATRKEALVSVIDVARVPGIYDIKPITVGDGPRREDGIGDGQHQIS